MFVCSCNAIREAEVRQLAHNGLTEACDVYTQLGCEPHCATCTDFIQSMLDEAAVSRQPTPA